MQVDRDIAEICARLYYGWVEKNDLPQLARDPVLLRSVQDELARMGLELINRPDCPWYVVRLFSEYDSFAQFARRNQSLKKQHLAMLLILYTKLLLPRRTGQVPLEEELMVTFAQVFHTYGHKFVSSRRRTAKESTVKSILTTLARLGFIVKRRGEEVYTAGPAMYMLGEDLLADVAEASIRALFALDQSLADTEADPDEEDL